MTREPEWDDETRDRALRLHTYESRICGCGCGQPVAQAYDKKQAYRVDHFTCQAGRALAIVRRKDAEEAERQNKPDGWADGRHYYAEPVDLEDINPEGVARG